MLSSLCLDCKHTRRHGDVHGVVVFVLKVKWVNGCYNWFSHTQSCDKINVSVVPNPFDLGSKVNEQSCDCGL